MVVDAGEIGLDRSLNLRMGSEAILGLKARTLLKSNIGMEKGICRNVENLKGQNAASSKGETFLTSVFV